MPLLMSPPFYALYITRCKSLFKASRHHTNLIPAHKYLIRHYPCLLEIHLPLFRTLTPTLSHIIASPVHLPPSFFAHSSISLCLTSPSLTLATSSISSGCRRLVHSSSLSDSCARKLWTMVRNVSVTLHEDDGANLQDNGIRNPEGQTNHWRSTLPKSSS